MSYRRRRKTVEPKRPRSPVASATATIGVLVILVFAAFLSLIILGYETAAKWMGGAGVILMIVSMISFGYGIKVFRNTDYQTLNRWLGMILPFIGMILWIWVYFTGIIYG